MDISIWKGYDPDDHSKNAAYYGLWYKRMVPSSATVEDDLNKYQVRRMPDMRLTVCRCCIDHAFWCKTCCRCNAGVL